MIPAVVGGFFVAQGAAGAVGEGIGAVNAVVFGEIVLEPDRDVKARWFGWAVAAKVACVATFVARAERGGRLAGED